jgi:hypothetical protein
MRAPRAKFVPAGLKGALESKTPLEFDLGSPLTRSSAAICRTITDLSGNRGAFDRSMQHHLM